MFVIKRSKNQKIRYGFFPVIYPLVPKITNVPCLCISKAKITCAFRLADFVSGNLEALIDILNEILRLQNS